MIVSERTREAGRLEQYLADRLGLRRHPDSGAGTEKGDASEWRRARLEVKGTRACQYRFDPWGYRKMAGQARRGGQVPLFVVWFRKVGKGVLVSDDTMFAAEIRGELGAPTKRTFLITPDAEGTATSTEGVFYVLPLSRAEEALCQLWTGL